MPKLLQHFSSSSFLIFKIKGYNASAPPVPVSLAVLYSQTKKLNTNQWEVHLIRFKCLNFFEDTRPGVKTLGLGPTPKSKSIAQHAYCQPKQTRI